MWFILFILGKQWSKLCHKCSIGILGCLEKELSGSVGSKLKRWSHCCCCCCLIVQSWLPLCDSVDCSLPGSSVNGIFQARILCHFLLQGIFPTQGSNLRLLHWHVDSLPSEPPGKPQDDYNRMSNQKKVFSKLWFHFHKYMDILEHT